MVLRILFQLKGRRKIIDYKYVFKHCAGNGLRLTALETNKVRGPADDSRPVWIEVLGRSSAHFAAEIGIKDGSLAEVFLLYYRDRSKDIVDFFDDKRINLF